MYPVVDKINSVNMCAAMSSFLQVLMFLFFDNRTDVTRK